MDHEGQLVLDTLYDRGSSNSQHCLSTNQAGLRLLECPPTVLPQIEQVLREIVNPVLSASITEKPKNLALDRLLGDFTSLVEQTHFPGLDYLLGAYMVIGAKSDFSRVERFLYSMSDPLLIEAISHIPVFFKRVNCEYNCGVSPLGEVMSFLKHLVKSEKQAIRVAADRVIEQVTNPSHSSKQ